jgi:protein O-mannosyl-transferase
MTLKSTLTRYIPITLILVIIILIYGNTLWNGFTYDDWGVIRDSLLIRNPKLIYTFFTKDYFTTSGEATYRPLVTLTYFLEFRIWQDRPWGYHLMNLVYHLIMVLLIYLWFTGYVGKWPAAGAALFFGIHPALSEAVNSIGYREDILAGLFVIAALLMHRAHLSKPNRIQSISAFIFVILALLSKEMAITFLPLCFLSDYVFTNKAIIKQHWKQYLGYSLVSLGYLILRFWLMANPVKEHTPYFGDSLVTAMISLPKLIWIYFILTIYPAILNIDRIVNPVKSIADLDMWLGLLLIIGLVIGIVKSKPGYRWSLLWFLIAMLPILNFIPIYNPFGERYLYLPYVGIAGLITFILQKYQGKKFIITIFILCIITLSTRTVIRNHDWRNDLALYSSAAKYPTTPRVHYNLGNQYRENKQFDKAMLEFQTTIAQAPYFVPAYNNLGMLYSLQGNDTAALIAYQRAVQISPNTAIAHNGLGIIYEKLNQTDRAIQEFKTAIRIKADYAETHFNLGILYLELNRAPEAISEFQQAIQWQPDFLNAYIYLGKTYSRLGQVDNAIKVFQTVIQRKLDYFAVYDTLAAIYITLGKYPEAVEILQQQARIFPQRIEPIQNLAKLYLQIRNPTEAISLFNQVLLHNANDISTLNDLAWIYATNSSSIIRCGEKAVELALRAANLTRFKDAGTLDTLAAAYAETGDFKLAISYEKQAIQLAPATIQKDFLKRLQIYQKNQAYREP